MRAAVVATLLIALVAAAAIAYILWENPGRPPDVILISVDTLRADRVGAYDYDDARTPTLDRLAARGTLFREATTPFPRTTPAFASLFTGLWPMHHGSREIGQPMRRGKLLAQALSEQGYHTVGVNANPAAGKRVKLTEGFEVYEEKHGFRITYEQNHNDDLFKAGRVTTNALDWVQSAPPEKPLFLWVNYADPHWQYRPPREWVPETSDGSCERLMRREQPLAFVFSDVDGRASEALADCSALYDAEIAYVDSEIARLLDGLDGLDRIDDAYVVVTSDHGESFGEGDLFYDHGPVVHDAAMRVPLIVVGPGIEEGRVDRGVARLEDVMPTLLSLLDLPPEVRPEMDGVDLSPRLRGESAGSHEALVAFAESGAVLLPRLHNKLSSGRVDGLHCLNGDRFSLCSTRRGKPRLYDRDRDPNLTRDVGAAHREEYERFLKAAERWPAETARERTVRTPRFKLVHYPSFRGGYSEALYDLERDPAESLDVAADHPELKIELRRFLREWLLEGKAPEIHQRSEEDLEALRGLGYIGE